MNVVAERFVVPADAKYLPEIRNFSSEYAQRTGLSRAEENSIKLAVDEICSNIVLYAYRGMKRGDIQIEMQKSGQYVVVRIIDSGMAFDYSTVKVPDLEQYIEEGRRGGLGLQLVKKLTDKFHYERIDNTNIITLHKKISSDPQ